MSGSRPMAARMQDDWAAFTWFLETLPGDAVRVALPGGCLPLDLGADGGDVSAAVAMPATERRGAASSAPPWKDGTPASAALAAALPWVRGAVAVWCEPLQPDRQPLQLGVLWRTLRAALPALAPTLWPAALAYALSAAGMRVMVDPAQLEWEAWAVHAQLARSSPAVLSTAVDSLTPPKTADAAPHGHMVLTMPPPLSRDAAAAAPAVKLSLPVLALMRAAAERLGHRFHCGVSEGTSTPAGLVACTHLATSALECWALANAAWSSGLLSDATLRVAAAQKDSNRGADDRVAALSRDGTWLAALRAAAWVVVAAAAWAGALPAHRWPHAWETAKGWEDVLVPWGPASDELSE